MLYAVACTVVVDEEVELVVDLYVLVLSFREGNIHLAQSLGVITIQNLKLFCFIILMCYFISEFTQV